VKWSLKVANKALEWKCPAGWSAQERSVWKELLEAVDAIGTARPEDEHHFNQWAQVTARAPRLDADLQKRGTIG